MTEQRPHLSLTPQIKPVATLTACRGSFSTDEIRGVLQALGAEQVSLDEVEQFGPRRCVREVTFYKTIQEDYQ